MGKKNRKNQPFPTTLNALVPAEIAAEEEILETPAIDLLDGRTDVSGKELEDLELEELELERSLVAEMRAKHASHPAKEVANKQALEAAIKEWNGVMPQLPWIETLDTSDVELCLTNVNDDLKREIAFYQQSLDSVRIARAKLLKLNVPYRRPSDFFAEMLKTDTQMARIKDKLIYEQKKIQTVEERKKSQAHRKVAKAVQSEKLQQRQQEKKKTLESLQQWKKNRQIHQRTQSTQKDEQDQEGQLQKILAAKPVRKGKNHKREHRNDKFGFGGRKAGRKRNTRESTNDLPDFGQKRSKRGKTTSLKRPGKTQRTNNRKRQRAG
uniref:rRNAprocessing protein EBP2 putative n=1 Tax=Albugo laibachii Nc14 TaxID=890382 RepID=F0WN12_9STRA|nr:rRNAprocessing protein EBP2 putative [Albugo laibachii Nc14]|eukprot:CCA22699.1 rRNAprocessing protein EBP2 putative [Albugo laibachii Nc14]